MWVAETTQDAVAPFPYNYCKNKGKKMHCNSELTRITYAIPLEIIYLTPLQSWNPYNIKMEEQKKCRECKSADRTTCKRTGDVKDKSKAYKCINSEELFYMTPSTFYKGRKAADVDGTDVGVLSEDGTEIHHVRASGVQIVMPKIQGIDGYVRLRYPISPVHGEGSSVWKELNALKKHVTDNLPSHSADVVFKMTGSSAAYAAGGGVPHDHEVSLSCRDFLKMYSGAPGGEVVTVAVDTAREHDHSHRLTVQYLPEEDTFVYILCDGEKICPEDGHRPQLSLVSDIANLDCTREREDANTE